MVLRKNTTGAEWGAPCGWSFHDEEKSTKRAWRRCFVLSFPPSLAAFTFAFYVRSRAFLLRPLSSLNPRPRYLHNNDCEVLPSIPIVQSYNDIVGCNQSRCLRFKQACGKKQGRESLLRFWSPPSLCLPFSWENAEAQLLCAKTTDSFAIVSNDEGGEYKRSPRRLV